MKRPAAMPSAAVRLLSGASLALALLPMLLLGPAAVVSQSSTNTSINALTWRSKVLMPLNETEVMHSQPANPFNRTDLALPYGRPAKPQAPKRMPGETLGAACKRLGKAACGKGCITTTATCCTSGRTYCPTDSRCYATPSGATGCLPHNGEACGTVYCKGDVTSCVKSAADGMGKCVFNTQATGLLNCELAPPPHDDPSPPMQACLPDEFCSSTSYQCNPEVFHGCEFACYKKNPNMNGEVCQSPVDKRFTSMCHALEYKCSKFRDGYCVAKDAVECSLPEKAAGGFYCKAGTACSVDTTTYRKPDGTTGSTYIGACVPPGYQRCEAVHRGWCPPGYKCTSPDASGYAKCIVATQGAA